MQFVNDMEFDRLGAFMRLSKSAIKASTWSSRPKIEAMVMAFSRVLSTNPIPYESVHPIQYLGMQMSVPTQEIHCSKLEKKKMYMQFYESSYFLLARKSIRYPQQRQYQKLGIIVYLFTNRIPTFRCLLNNHQRRYRYSARQRSNHLFRQSIGKV